MVAVDPKVYGRLVPVGMVVENARSMHMINERDKGSRFSSEVSGENPANFYLASAAALVAAALHSPL
eukprot:10554288-Ditylum_brightwellii.AAC.1